MGHVRRYPPVRFAVRVELDQKRWEAGKGKGCACRSIESRRLKIVQLTGLIPIRPMDPSDFIHFRWERRADEGKMALPFIST